MSVAVAIDDRAVRAALARLAKPDLPAALKPIGALVESATRRRIETEKKGPHGERWPAWSEGYAKSRKKGKSRLRSSGALLDSIQYQVQGDSVVIGSNLEYAAIHQFGGPIHHPERAGTVYFKLSRDKQRVGTQFVKKAKSDFAQDVIIGAHTQTMPPRPYLGISAADQADIAKIILDAYAHA